MTILGARRRRELNENDKLLAHYSAMGNRSPIEGRSKWSRPGPVDGGGSRGKGKRDG